MNRMHGNARLTSLDIAVIKCLLWDGDTHLSIANRYKVSGVHIGKICRGIAYPDIEWPNGSTGSIPEDRRKGGRPREIEYTNTLPDPIRQEFNKKMEEISVKVSDDQDMINDDNLLFNVTGGLRGNSRKEKT